MKKLIIILLTLCIKTIGQTEYKYCELVGFNKTFSAKLIVAVDSGAAGKFSYEMIKDTVESEKPVEYKNEKVYVTTDQAMYEGKAVNSDAKGKFIWKKVEVNPVSTEKKVKNKTFTSMVDAMNYMGKDGWEFVQAYVVTASNQNVYRWLLKKKVK
jgi:hypothetical protein